MKKKGTVLLLGGLFSISVIFPLQGTTVSAIEPSEEYLQQKNELLTDNYNPYELTENEQKLDEKLTEMKSSYEFEVYDASVIVNPEVWESELYQFCQSIPKGSDLHTHCGAMISAWDYIDTVSQFDTVYMNTAFQFDMPADDQEYLLINVENPSDVPEGYVNLKQGILDGTIDDEALADYFLVQSKTDDYTGWGYMNNASNFRVKGMTDEMATQMYITAMKNYCENNIMHVEGRWNLHKDLKKNNSTIFSLLHAYKAVKKEYPDFVFSVIACCSKSPDNSLEDVENMLIYGAKMSKVLWDVMDSAHSVPFIVGLDLVGEEDVSVDLDQYESIIKKVKEEAPNLKISLHAGESLKTENDNIADAYVLGAERFGHGLHLFQNPTLMDKIKETNRAIELCPISNNLLGYVVDLRRHPGIEYLRRGVPVVLSSDDALYECHEILSDDFYLAVVSWDLSLADIKLLCRNSIEYSFADQDLKEILMNRWEKEWDQFVEQAIA